jgi:hypothetical protein
MKKAEDYLNKYKGEGVFTYEVFKSVALKAIRDAQEDAIRETVKECASKARTAFKQLDNDTWEVFVDKDKILSVVNKLIKEL